MDSLIAEAMPDFVDGIAKWSYTKTRRKPAPVPDLGPLMEPRSPLTSALFANPEFPQGPEPQRMLTLPRLQQEG